jgi:hypothetical protein
MRKIILFPFALLLSLFAMAQTPVAYYPLNGNANDTSGNALNGTITGTVTPVADRFGNANSAGSFNGASRIDVPDNPLLRPANVTLSAWVYFTTAPFTEVIANKNIANSGFESYAIFFFNGNIAASWGNPGAFQYMTGPVPTTSQWHFVAMTFDDANNLASLYLDGVLVNSMASTLTLGYDNSTFSIATELEYGIYNFFYNGIVDDVKIHGTALTTTQVQAEYVYNNHLRKPGSGNALSFDGVDDHMIASTAGYTGIQTYTIECWIKKTAPNLENNVWETNGALSAPSLESNGATDLNFWVGNSSFLSTGPLNSGQWYHIACVYDKVNTTQNLYLNGILKGTANVNVTDVIGSNIGFMQRILSGIPRNFNGELDEIRIWNTPLSQTQIRDRMSKKITTSDPLYSNLVAYYNLDESTGTTAFDGTVNANNGTLTNSPTRVTSGAAIGNASSHDYVNATKTTSLAHPTGESFTVTSTSGSPDGIQVYRVDEQPNTLSGAVGVGSNDKYFGVFQVNGTAPQYTAVYNYNGNPAVNPGNENQLRLNKRADNAAAAWTIMIDAPNEPANTITITGESTEYILGKLGFALPLNLISFSGSKQNNDALLQWKTANEAGVSKFEVQRSNDGQTFTSIGTVAAGGSSYSFTDVNTFSNRTVAFYRLKSIDVNARFTYSNIIKLSKQTSAALTVYPNPVSDVLTISGLKQNGTITIYNQEGKLLQQQTVTAQTMTMDMSKYVKGMYLLQYKTEDEVVNQKIIKQ